MLSGEVGTRLKVEERCPGKIKIGEGRATGGSERQERTAKNSKFPRNVGKKYSTPFQYFQISGLMDKFEKEFEDLDVQTSVMENTMGRNTRRILGYIRSQARRHRRDLIRFCRQHDGDERAAGRGGGPDEAGGRRGRAGAEHGAARRREQHHRHDGGQQRPGRVEPEAGQAQAVDLVMGRVCDKEGVDGGFPEVAKLMSTMCVMQLHFLSQNMLKFSNGKS